MDQPRANPDFTDQDMLAAYRLVMSEEEAQEVVRATSVASSAENWNGIGLTFDLLALLCVANSANEAKVSAIIGPETFLSAEFQSRLQQVREHVTTRGGDLP